MLEDADVTQAQSNCLPCPRPGLPSPTLLSPKLSNARAETWCMPDVPSHACKDVLTLILKDGMGRIPSP